MSLIAVFREGDTTRSLTELLQRTQLYKSTALRLLASLEHANLVQRVEHSSHHAAWTLGKQVARLHAIYTASFSLDRVVLPALRKLGSVTGESAAYHVRQGPERICLFAWTRPTR